MIVGQCQNWSKRAGGGEENLRGFAAAQRTCATERAPVDERHPVAEAFDAVLGLARALAGDGGGRGER